MLAALIGSCAIACAGGPDECGEDETRCVGGELEACRYGSGRYRFESSGVSCGGSSRFSSEKIHYPLCMGQVGDCYEGLAIDCAAAQGFADGFRDCAGDDLHCVLDDEGIAFCATSAGRDPKCDVASAPTSFCEGDVQVQCRDGFAERATACACGCAADGDSGSCTPCP
jgi:hypothetical protein